MCHYICLFSLLVYLLSFLEGCRGGGGGGGVDRGRAMAEGNFQCRVTFSAGVCPTNLDNRRARAFSACRWEFMDICFSHFSFLSAFLCGGRGRGGVGWCDSPWWTSSARASYNLDNSRARAYCACSRCGWGREELFRHFYFRLSFFSSLSLSLGDGQIQNEILSQKAAKPKTTNPFFWEAPR